MGSVCAAGSVLGPNLRQPEVEHFHVAPSGQHDIRGLDIAMRDPLGVRRHQRIGDLLADRQNLRGVHGSVADGLGERGTFNQFQDECAEAA